MQLADILACFDLGGSPPKLRESLLRAYLAGLLHAVKMGHVDNAVAKDFIESAKRQWSALPPVKPVHPGHADFSGLGIETLWGEFHSLLHSFDGRMYLQHCGMLDARGAPPEDPADAPLVTILDDSVFKFWLRDDVPEVRFDEKGAAQDILDLIRACKERELVKDGAMVGRPNSVVWLTPKSGTIGKLIDRAESMAGREGDLENMGIADTIRNRLGLWQKSSRHGVAVILKRSYSDLIREAAAKVKAPTIFDAEGYERFRHWPSPADAPPDRLGRGRTYELDPAIRVRERPSDGAPEIVAPARPFDEIASIVYLGRFGTPPGKGESVAEQESCAEFADAVAGANVSLAEIVRGLGSVLKA